MLSPMEWIYFNKMTVIDTPDHVDFTPEVVENALCSFDGAALVLSSVDGLQIHSIADDKQMIEYQLPRHVFINNLDHKVADPLEVVDQARSKLPHHSAALQVPISLGYSFKGLVDLVQSKAYFFHASNGVKVVAEKVPAEMEALVLKKRHELIKTVSEVDDKPAEAFNGDKSISVADLQEAIRRATIAHKFVPVFMGSAFKYKTRSKLQHQSAALQFPTGLGYSFKGLVDLVHSKAYFFHASNGEKATVEEVPSCMEVLVSRKRRDLIETVSEVDNKLAEAFCSDKSNSAAGLEEAVLIATRARKFIPVFMGSASENKMTVIDTPVHFDFTAEVKSALPAFDGAVLDLSSVDGVQEQHKSFAQEEFPPSLRQDRKRKFLKGILVTLIIFLLFTPVSAQCRFDHYTFALQWASGVIAGTKTCTSKPVSRLLTIHGLWPSNKRRPHPSSCPKVPYDSILIDSLKSDLSIAWPSIYGDDDAFWARQWEKHGICSTFKQYEYFKHALELWKAHNITSLLEEKGITPGGLYDYQHINTTILNEIGSVPHITCEGSTYLAEIHLCFDAATATQFVSCSPFAQSNCKGRKGKNKISFER